MVFLMKTDTFVLGSQIQPLNKPAFYQPSVLYIQPDVTFKLSVPTARTIAIRMAFYWDVNLIMNITAIDYYREQASTAFAFIVIDNSDIVSGALLSKGYANNNY